MLRIRERWKAAVCKPLKYKNALLQLLEITQLKALRYFRMGCGQLTLQMIGVTPPGRGKGSTAARQGIRFYCVCSYKRPWEPRVKLLLVHRPSPLDERIVSNPDFQVM
jgi:hypothetical protein